MNWKNILKMPMPINTRGDRDEQYRQKIIDYEKNTIEPALTEYYSQNTAAENKPFNIYFNLNSRDLPFNPNSPDGLEYGIGQRNASILGGNRLFILGVIKDLYEKEGYKVSLDETGSNEKITITQ